MPISLISLRITLAASCACFCLSRSRPPSPVSPSLPLYPPPPSPSYTPLPVPLYPSIFFIALTCLRRMFAASRALSVESCPEVRPGLPGETPLLGPLASKLNIGGVCICSLFADTHCCGCPKRRNVRGGVVLARGGEKAVANVQIRHQVQCTLLARYYGS